jgi:Tfp pilus assembly protein PilF
MLLKHGVTKDALVAFEATLTKEPNRLGATIGAARAAEKIGDPNKTRQYYSAAVALAQGSDPSRAEVADARAFMARQPPR